MHYLLTKDKKANKSTAVLYLRLITLFYIYAFVNSVALLLLIYTSSIGNVIYCNCAYS